MTTLLRIARQQSGIYHAKACDERDEPQQGDAWERQAGIVAIFLIHCLSCVPWGTVQLANQLPQAFVALGSDGVPVVVPRSLLVPSLAIALTPNSYFWPFVRPLPVADGDGTVPPLIQVLDPYGR